MIRVRGLKVTVPGRLLLSEVELTVPSGTVLGVYGPNGAGKSTLLKALAGVPGLDREGEVEIDGTEISPLLDPAVRCRKVLRLGSDFHSPFGVRVSELFGMAERPGGSRDAVRETVERLGLGDLLTCEFGTLSDGQKQWAMFGRALIQDPPVLILDETFSKLDLDRLSSAKKLIRERVSTGKVVVVASHDLNRLASWSDRLLLLASGKVIAEGPVGTILNAENLGRLYPGSGLEIDPANRLRVLD